MPTPVPPIGALPTPPDPDDRSTFNARAYPWSAALPGFGEDLTGVAENVLANATEASVAATNAAAQAAAAVAAVGAEMWVAGTYTSGDVVWSPTNGRSYRRRTTGASSVDPQADPTNWWDVSAYPAVPIVDVSTDTLMSVGVEYRFTASVVLTMPASAQIGEWVAYVNRSGAITATINGNGANIMGSPGVHTIDNANAAGRLVLSSEGWIYG